MARRDAREVAMCLLYQIEFCNCYSNESLHELSKNFNLTDLDIDYINEITEGYKIHQNEINEFISKYAKGWTIERIAKVDLSILRLAIYEILYKKDVPIAVSINEGVELAKKYSTDKSQSFINGILGSLVRSIEGNQEKD